MKKVKPQVPVVMLTDHLELTEGTLKSVDALVTKSDGPHFLWATVHFILNVKPPQNLEEKLSKSNTGTSALRFSLRVWQSIRNGTAQF